MLPKVLMTAVVITQLLFLAYLFSILFYANEMWFLVLWALALSLVTWGIFIPITVASKAEKSFLNYAKIFISLVLLSTGTMFLNRLKLKTSKQTINYIAKRVSKEVKKEVQKKVGTTSNKTSQKKGY